MWELNMYVKPEIPSSKCVWNWLSGPIEENENLCRYFHWFIYKALFYVDV